MESINFITPSKEYPKTETNNIQIDHFNGKLKFKWTVYLNVYFRRGNEQPLIYFLKRATHYIRFVSNVVISCLI